MFLSFKKEFKIPSQWSYRGEGNCNVVISLPKQKKILRIRKANKSKSLFTWIIKLISNILSWYLGDASNDENRDLTFYKNIIRPLLENCYVCDAKQVFLSKKQINELEYKINKTRPDYRRHKRLQYGRAALFDDYAFFHDKNSYSYLSHDTFAIEIKPKQGWIPFSERHFPECVFCMNQYLKLKKGQIKTVSTYCPLDLFSGETARITKALKSLIRNPQNNLKIFKNGESCYSENASFESFESFVSDFFNNKTDKAESLTDEFCLLLQKCLLTNFDSAEKPQKSCDKKLFCEWNKVIRESAIQNKLPKGSVLERILSVQMLDAEGNQYYCKLLGNKNIKDYDYVRDLLGEVSGQSKTCLKCTIMMLGDTDKSRDNLVFVPYLISAVAKDCSLMLTFKRIVEASSDLGAVFKTKYGDFAASVGIFDLYPKPVSTILKHRKKYMKIQEIYANEVISS